jgi:pSer/pThr/pTyr-binding forkhead associated (FHA) protein
MYYRLVMLNGQRRGREIPIKGGDTIIGRIKGCKIRISAHEVSRKHCRLRIQGENVSLKDLGSANGTRVNGRPITGEYLLQPNDRVQVGPVTFMLERRTGLEPKDAIPVDAIEIIEDTVQQPAAVVAQPPEMERVTVVEYVPKPSAFAPPPDLPVADLDDLPTATPDSSSEIVVVEVAEDNLEYAQLDDEQPAQSEPATQPSFEQWLVVDEQPAKDK